VIPEPFLIIVYKLLSILPLPFWVGAILLIIGTFWGIRNLRTAIGLPLLAVIMTVAVWYMGDAFYNDYVGYHSVLFEADTLQSAWWQVAWFLTVFLLFTPVIHQQLNARYIRNGSGVLHIFKHGIDDPMLQKQMRLLFRGCIIVWGVLILIVVARVRSQIPYFFFPFLGYRAEPWGRGRIGSGFDAFLSLAFYIQLLVTSIFGVIAALLTDRRLRRQALIFCALTWPYFFFDRTRNTMLAIAIPGILSWAFLRLRGGFIKKGAVLLAFFLVINAWMGFVLSNRGPGQSVVSAFEEKGFSLTGDSAVHHEGLNMYEELCWITSFIEEGKYKPNWGQRYFAELVNPIPRVIWHGKPLIGIDYAILRGQGLRGAGPDTEGSGGVYATISTGLIGQGVVNFGQVLGPAFAALLMSLWVAVLARLDLQIQELGRLPLYSLGLIMTFNLGRDITLITLYPFLFGAGAIWWYNRNRRKASDQPKASAQSAAPMPNLKAQATAKPLFASRNRSPLFARRANRISTRVSFKK